ncbi:MAG: response regulator [Arenimonas sp.]
MHARPQRILIVDDNRDSADSLATAFVVLGHEAVATYGGREGLGRLAEVRPSLIVLDLSMPEMDGYTLARAIRALPGYATVPMVALSGFGSEADRVKSHEAGFNRHMLKPFDLADLERMLELIPEPAP